ncbi:MAG: sigma-70 family RNA polymerase sigma factor [Chryseolinea sp.]
MSTYISKSDPELLELYKSGGGLDVLGLLYGRYTSMVYGVCLKYLKDREESKDAVMQIFEKLVTTARTHEVGHFKSWLYVTARNHCLMQLRSRKGKYFEEISPGIMENEPSPHPDEGPEMEANLSKLENCIQKLVPEQQQCVSLFYLEQKCYKDIVSLTGYDDNKVKSYIQNGKRNLKICMESNA